MKKGLLFIVFALCQILISQAQTFNYQAAVRDNAGDLINNQAMSVQVRLLDGGPAGTEIYNEIHNVTSNAHGIIDLPVGGGIVNGNFTSFHSISWNQGTQWIDISIDLAGGTTYVNIGSSQLRYVPYAMYSINSGNAANANHVFGITNNVVSNESGNNTQDDFVFGSSQLDNNGSFNPAFGNRMFFDKSKAAFRAGYSQQSEWDEANVGNYSVGFGEGGTASGNNSFSMGRNANATADYTFAFGLNAGGFAQYGMGLGQGARAFGQHAKAMGTNLNANSFGEIQLGQYSTYTTGDVNNFVSTDRLFVIGNGQYDINAGLNSDALVMLKNGNTTLNGQLTIDGDNQGAGKKYTLPAQDGTSNQMMQTDGSGFISWVTPAADTIPNGGNTGDVLSTDGLGVLSWINNDVLPVGGNTNDVLRTDGSGNYSWVTTDDADADATNEIELPTGGTDGQVLKTDGSGNYAWINQPELPTTVFSTVNNITSNAPGNIAADNFVFGSTQIDNIAGVDDNSRMFFHKTGGAFRAGINIDSYNGFDVANIGYGSVGFGINNTASGWYSATLGGILNNSTGFYSVTAGNSNIASGSSSIAFGQYNNASGLYSSTIGNTLTSESAGQITLGTLNTTVVGNVNSYVATDRLLVIGNGTSDINGINRSDALVVLKNGNTTINGQLTIDGDNQGSGTSYTLPAQDGAANQVMSTDGAGNVSWITASSGGSVENISTVIFETNWENYSVVGGNDFEDSQFYKHDNQVFIGGLIHKTSGVNTGDIMFTLPMGYRPAKNRIFTTQGENGLVRVDVNSNGEVVIKATFDTVLDWVSLDGILFRVN